MDQREQGISEPADRPVHVYESLLALAAQLLVFASYWTHTRLTTGAAVCSLALLFSLSLWKLLKPPPRFSATRCAYLLISVFAVVLLLHW